MFRTPIAHHQEKQLCLYETWYLLYCVDECLLCMHVWLYLQDYTGMHGQQNIKKIFFILDLSVCLETLLLLYNIFSIF
jgi:hypothetical protein